MSRQRIWAPPGTSADVAGHTIPGGLVYVGQYLRSGVGAIEPALINPALPIERHDPDRPVHGLDPAPAYHLISAAHRAGYLAWLAGGRVRTDVPIGFVRLFFSGLERRVLLDLNSDPSARAELPAIRSEVRRLRARHGLASRPFDAQAGAFLDVLNLLTAARSWTPARTWPDEPPPVPSDDRSRVPLALRVALAQFAISGVAVPADWARCWAWYHPALFPTTPQTRCPDEFSTLFAVRYRRRLASGLRPSPVDRPPIRIGYQPANPGIDTLVVDRPDLPDVLAETTSSQHLGALVDSVTEALTPYSRWLARTPGGAGSTASTMLLPSDLLDHDPGPLRPLLSWANARLDGGLGALVDGRDFTPFWVTADPAKMSREESGALAVVLSRIGIGLEPDVRFGGAALQPGPVVLFRLDPEAPDRPSAGYPGALIMLSIAAAVLPRSADRPEDAGNRTITALAAEVPLTIGERSRLSARLRWLLAGTAPVTTSAGVARLRRRAEVLTVAEREAAGHFLLSVALSGTASGTVTSETVSALSTAYRVIGLPEDVLYRRLHRSSMADDDAPVIVRRSRPGATGHPLPLAPRRPDRVAPVSPAQTADETGGPAVVLRQSVVSRTMAATESVSALLSGIFTEDDADSAAPAPAQLAGTTSPSGTGVSAGLDEVHASLLRELATRSSWSRSDLEELAGRLGVLPDGALDQLNEVALEVAGEPVVEGDDELTVNDEVLREILA